ncbi:hypothetical protein [Planctomycetes bacterium TBK1r]|uniref:hypothetical protein n=1 Tax=Stieleria magnilauensis TaxID=2527963 RepID=UPI0011A8358C
MAFTNLSDMPQVDVQRRREIVNLLADAIFDFITTAVIERANTTNPGEQETSQNLSTDRLISSSTDRSL